jgi:hypothetical protein
LNYIFEYELYFNVVDDREGEGGEVEAAEECGRCFPTIVVVGWCSLRISVVWAMKGFWWYCCRSVMNVDCSWNGFVLVIVCHHALAHLDGRQTTAASEPHCRRQQLTGAVSVVADWMTRMWTRLAVGYSSRRRRNSLCPPFPQGKQALLGAEALGEDDGGDDEPEQLRCWNLSSDHL